MAAYRRENRKVRGWKSGKAGRKDGLCSRCRKEIDGAHPAYCKACYNAWKKARYDANPEHYREAARKWQRENPEKMKLASRRWNMLTKYNLTLEQYEEMVAAQGGKCGACELEPDYGRGVPLLVDHNHETKENRGLLCMKCNAAQGLLGDSHATILKLAAYRARWP